MARSASPIAARTTPTAGLRDALVRALITPHAGRAPAHLVKLDDTAALLTLPDRGETLYVLDADDDARLQRIVRERRPGTTHVAVVGGSNDTPKALRRRRPMMSLDRKLVFHHVDGPTVWHLGGRLHRLVEAAEEVAQTRGAGVAPPLSTEEIEASRARLRDAVEHQVQANAALAQRLPIATWCLLAVCVVVFSLELVWGGAQSVSTLWRMGANDAERIALGEPWRLLSSTLLHAGALHLGVNLFALWSLGGVLERPLGTRRFIVLWTMSALAGSLASTLTQRSALTVGASGALFGLVAALATLALRRPDLFPRSKRRKRRRQLAAPITLVLVSSLSIGSDLAAHAGGALCGLVLVAWPAFTRGLQAPENGVQRQEPLELTAASIALSVALLLSFSAALTHGRPWELAAPPVTQRITLGDSGLSILLPERLVRHAPERNGDAMRWAFGEELRDPITVEVWVQPQTGPSLEETYRSMKASFPPNEAGPAVTLEWESGQPTVVFDRRIQNGEHLREWLSDRGDWRVVVRAKTVEHLPPGWMSTRDRLGKSLRDGR